LAGLSCAHEALGTDESKHSQGQRGGLLGDAEARLTIVGALVIAHPSQNKEPQHPPHKKQGDDAEDNVRHPLAAGFGLSEAKHRAIVAFRLVPSFFRRST
jgi:hypothetical protein